jgi:hypothetical protein
MRLVRWMLIVAALNLAACAGTQPIKFQATEVISKDVYTQSPKTNGVVLMDINWGRWWGCGGYENAQLISLAFDRLPVQVIDDQSEPALVLHSPSRIMVDPVFLNYAYSLEPGEYALSAISIKAAKSTSDVGFFTARRSHLYKDGMPIGGSFTINPGEVVYIGSFFLDCAYGPTLWRYYPDGREAFNEKIEAYKNSYPFLDLSDVKFRLFKTKVFGRDYDLVK